VLVTTSIGQEGLDFHRWARHLVHWDLPDNPVDLEQRDGRLNRHGSLAVRSALGTAMSVRELDPARSPWHSIARRFEAPTGATGIEPWWHVDGAEIRRTLLVASFSEQWDRCLRLQSELDLYRLALGQPDQEQLLSRLQLRFKGIEREQVRAWLRTAAIDLSPGGSRVTDEVLGGSR
jgi:superfamily II DNA/RNA helicase